MKRRKALAVIGVATGLAGCSNGSSTNATQAVDTSYECDSSESSTGKVSELSEPIYGSSSAPNTVEVFEDFACPHCRDFHLNTLPDLKDEIGNEDSPEFNIVHYDAPIPVSNWSLTVAHMGRFIQDTVGDDAFFEFSKAAYEIQDSYTWQTLADVAVETELVTSPCAMLGAAENRTYSPVIEANRKEAFDERRIQGTPAVFVNGTILTKEDVSTILGEMG